MQKNGWNDIMQLIAGVDEAGRGPLAGPVVAAAVIIEEVIDGVKDSKKISEKNREILAEKIKCAAIAYAYGRAEPHEIDELNIHHATLLAMKRAIQGLGIKPSLILVDGLYIPDTGISSKAIVKGDSLIYQISAASILAKVARDHEMIQLDGVFPAYGFKQHKGYPTKMHRSMIEQHGLVPDIHRMSFNSLINKSEAKI